MSVRMREINIKKRLIQLGELRRAKEFYIGQLRLALEDTSDHMFWIGDPTLHLNKTYNFRAILREVKKITPDDLRRVARSILKSSAMRLAVIGPAKEGDKKLHACLRKL